MMEWGSKEIIGGVKNKFKDIFRPDRRWDVWKGFYNGWIEGRVDMIFSITQEAPLAYEYHNFETGHSYVDYIERDGMGEAEGYTKIALYRI